MNAVDHVQSGQIGWLLEFNVVVEGQFTVLYAIAGLESSSVLNRTILG